MSRGWITLVFLLNALVANWCVISRSHVLVEFFQVSEGGCWMVLIKP